MQRLLTAEELDEIVMAYVNAGLPYNEQVRAALRYGVPNVYAFGLVDAAIPSIQIRLDLQAFNDVVRLTDGTVPLEIWLRTAVASFGPTPAAKTFAAALEKVQRRASGAPTVVAATANLPIVQEKTIERDDTLPFPFILAAAVAGRSVARLSVARYEDGQPVLRGSGDPVRYTGTGWILAEGLLMTNHHVVAARDDGEPRPGQADFLLQGANLTAEFDFDSMDAQREPVGGMEVLAQDQGLDYAVLGFDPARLPGRPPLRLAEAPAVVAGVGDYFAVNIVQHPGGAPKRVALRNNLVYFADDKKMQYFADTQGGSSGSPVFDDIWRVAALHHSSAAVQNVQFQGRTVGWVNQGTPIHAILAHLKNSFPAVSDRVAP